MAEAALGHRDDICSLHTALPTLAIGTLSSFVIGRMRLRNAWLVSSAALLTYAIPKSFLVIPFYRVMQICGLADGLWAVIFVDVTFTTSYAISTLQQYGTSIPIQLDEAARIDEANGAGDGSCRHLRPAACLERVSISVSATVIDADHDSAGREGIS